MTEREFEVTYPLTFIIPIDTDGDPDKDVLAERFADMAFAWLSDGGEPDVESMKIKEL